MDRRDWVRLPQAEIPHGGRLDLGVHVVNLVGSQNHRLVATTQHLHHGLVLIRGADGGVDDEQDGICGGDGEFGLLGDTGRQAVGVRGPAAGVDEDEIMPSPFGVVGDPVPGHTGGVLHDGLAASQNSVDECGLAHIGPSHDGDDRSGKLLLGWRVSFPSLGDRNVRGISSPDRGDGLIFEGHVVLLVDEQLAQFT